MSLSIDRLNWRPIRRKTSEKSCNASKTDFQRLSPRDLDLCPLTLQMHIYTVFTNVYTPAKFHQCRMKNDREIATSGFSILCPCDLDLWPSHPKKYTATRHCLSSGQVSSRSDKKWQRNRVTQVAVKKKNKMKKTRIEPVGRSAFNLNCNLGRFINRILGWNIQGHKLNIYWLIVALEDSMWGVFSYYLKYIVPFADSSTDPHFLFYLTVTLTFSIRTCKFTEWLREVLPIYQLSFE